MKVFFRCLAFIFIALTQLSAQEGWEQQSSTTTEDLYDVFFVDENIGWVVGGNGTILNTVNGGEIWNLQNSGTTHILWSVQFINETTGWIVGEDTIFYTEDAGTNWYVFEHDSLERASSLYFVDENHGWIYGGDHLLKTNDGGKNWEAVPCEYDRLINIFFINDKIGWFSDYFYIYKTENGGYTIEEIEEGFVYINSLFFLNPNLGWLAKGGVYEEDRSTSGGIYITKDAGYTWDEQIYGSTEYSSIYFFDEYNGMAIGSSGGARGVDGWFYKTIDGGQNWESQILPNPKNHKYLFINDFYFIDKNTGWIVGRYGFILKTSTGGFSSISQKENIKADEFRLSQNYPNPFNPRTTIEYDLPKATDVRIDVYIISGQRIQTLLNEKKPAGNHQIEFNAENLSSGVYFYRIEAGEFQDVKKMILLQ